MPAGSRRRTPPESQAPFLPLLPDPPSYLVCTWRGLQPASLRRGTPSSAALARWLREGVQFSWTTHSPCQRGSARRTDGQPESVLSGLSCCESFVQGEHVTPTAAARTMTASTCDRWRWKPRCPDTCPPTRPEATRAPASPNHTVKSNFTADPTIQPHDAKGCRVLQSAQRSQLTLLCKPIRVSRRCSVNQSESKDAVL